MVRNQNSFGLELSDLYQYQRFFSFSSFVSEIKAKPQKSISQHFLKKV